MSSVLVRTNLTPKEWAEFRKLVIDLGEPASKASGDAMRDYLKTKRALLKGAKP